MLTPEYIDHAPDELVELYRQAEDDILRDMAKRISSADLYIPSTQWQERKLQAMGMTHKEIVRRLSALTRKTNAEIESIIGDAGARALNLDADVMPTYKGLAISTAPWVQSLIVTGIARTQGTFRNLTLTAAQTATGQFERALDRAYMQVSTGAFAQDKAIIMAVKDLCSHGIEAITYPTGRKEYIDVAVRRSIITGLNQTAGEVADRLAKELDYDLVEVSAHAGARPSHAEWQGKVYSRKGKTEKYEDFYTATGYGTGAGLCGWNCRHSFSAYQEGQARAYTPEMLAKFEAKDYSYNGKAMTEYEATQKQRYIERQIRRYKREAMATRDIGQDADAAEAKVHEWQKLLTDFCRQTGLKKSFPRAVVPGYGRD